MKQQHALGFQLTLAAAGIAALLYAAACAYLWKEQRQLIFRPQPVLARTPATFTSLSELARLEYPWIPVDWLLHERFDTLIKIGGLNLPIVFVHGTADDEVPPPMTERLYRAARGDKQLVWSRMLDTNKQCPWRGNLW